MELEEESNFKYNLDAVKIASCLKEDTESFKLNLWLIELLTTEVMVKKPLYWKELFIKCEVPVLEPNDDMCLRVYL